MTPINDYITAIRQQLSTGIAREHAYRPALKALIEALDTGVIAVNDPQRIECGAPDYIITRNGVHEAYIEAKDINEDLRKVEKTGQLKRYLDALPNLILTDYIEFRWYVQGELKETVRLGEVDGGKLQTTKAGQDDVIALLNNFLAFKAPIVGTAKDLATRMANLAHMIRDATLRVLHDEDTTGQLHKQLKAFQEVLVPGLTEEDFADMYAQTIAYGLFAARCNHQPGRIFNRQSASWDLPKTNPFLCSMFGQIAGQNLDDRIAWIVDDLAEFLARADMSHVLEDFQSRTGHEDPVVHFYETFLREYDPKLRELRGVYYTPEPVVSYIVRSVDHVLKTEFNKPLGLADPNVCILDPACGTGTFLYFTIRHIHATVVKQMGSGAWPSYVRDNLLKRLFGFELLMAPYTIAHMKLAMLLQELGYNFPDDQRLGIYLTNTLEEATQKSDIPFGQFIADEANTANAVKREKPIMVIIGNPPYSGNSANDSERTVIDFITKKVKKGKTWIGNLIEDYKKIDGVSIGERKQWLQDDYVKFMRFAQWRLQETGCGILGFITNHSYLDNPTSRGMRHSLLKSFNKIWLLDLHGGQKKREKSPDGTLDANIFSIKTGVSIGLFTKTTDAEIKPQIFHANLWGTQASKDDFLNKNDVSTVKHNELSPTEPFYLFIPQDKAGHDEWKNAKPISSIMQNSVTGIQTSRDTLVIDIDKDKLLNRLKQFCDSITSIQELKLKSTRSWNPEIARQQLQQKDDLSNEIFQYAYRPFDSRWIYYSKEMIDWPRKDVMSHMESPNIALCVGRAGHVVGNDIWNLCFVASDLIDLNLFYRGGAQISPLYLYPSEGTLNIDDHRQPNISLSFINELKARLGLEFITDGTGDLTVTFGPEDIFHYIYAVLHSPAYRDRYSEFLKIDFPRIPLISNLSLFKDLCSLGKDMIALHLMEAPVLDTSLSTFEGTGDNLVEKVRYVDTQNRVYINKDQYFANISPALFKFMVGGYQVMDKWLKDRKDRKLVYDDIRHYCRIAVALTETTRLMTEIDEVIIEHGGFPAAFA